MKWSIPLKRIAGIGLVLTAIAVLGGCREEEQGRPVLYEKGTYQGKPDQKLTAAQVEELRSRARMQAF